MSRRRLASRSRAPILATCCVISWLLLGIVVFRALPSIPYEIVGGTYSNTDGNWAEWNALGILRFGAPFDLSPFNAFAGSGNMFLPNLPWLSPGAAMLGLVADRASAHVASYLVYAFVLCASIIVLARTLGLSWLAASAAAQLHLVVLFPPFSLLFLPMEWYSAAPVYAQISAVWNFALAVFLSAGRASKRWVSAVAVVVVPPLILIGCFSAPFSFLFFGAPYLTLGMVLLFSRVVADSPGRSMLVLPIQFSNCLALTDHLSVASQPALLRGNFFQTVLVFEHKADVSINLDFGLPWRTGCRRQDINYLEGLSL